MIMRKAAFLLNSGKIINTDGSTILTFAHSAVPSFFTVIYHRNHLPVISSTVLTESGGIYTYNFTTGADKVYGEAAGYKQLSPTVWGMVSGDANADWIVDSTDISTWKPSAGEQGYFQTDFNLDSQIENKDKDDHWLNNIGMESYVPE
jgi:hypothetical protein